MTALDKLKAAYRSPEMVMGGVSRVVLAPGGFEPVVVFRDGTWTFACRERVRSTVENGWPDENGSLMWSPERFVTAGLLTQAQAAKARGKEDAARWERDLLATAKELRERGWTVTPPKRTP